MIRNNQDKKPFKVLTLFNIFSSDKITQLGKFLQSPYFGVSETNLTLFECLKSRKQKGILEQTTKKIIADRVFPKRQYSDRKVNNAISGLTKSIETFLSLEELKQNQRISKKIKLEAFAKTPLNEKFGNLLKKSHQELDEDPVKNAIYYRGKIFLLELQYIYPYKVIVKEQKNIPHSILKLTEQYNAFLQLQYHCELLNRSKITSEVFQINRLHSKEKEVFRTLIKNNQLARIYFNILKLAIKDINQKVLFKETKESYLAINDHLSKSENRLISQHLLNYTTRQIDCGNEKYKAWQFELYKTSLQKNTIVIDGQMTHTTYLNIVVSALSQNDFQWTEKFIHDYKNKLISTHQENACSFAMAFLYFTKKELLSSYDELKKIKTGILEYKLRIKSLLLRVLYEINSTLNVKEEELEKHINNFKVFINRNKEKYSKEKIKSYNNYISFVEKLYLLNGQYIPKEKRVTLKEILNNTPLIIARMWLFEMIKKLK